MVKRSQAITVIGAGRMGRGIALSFSYHGYVVTLVDVKNRSKEQFSELLVRSDKDFTNKLNVLIKAELMTEREAKSIREHIQIVHIDHNRAGWKDNDIVFEAVPEILTVKEATYQTICSIIPSDALLLSTTSSFSANDLAQLVTNKERYMNTHWLNPA